MRPHHQGADVIMPDDVASKMVENGDAEDPRPFPKVTPTVKPTTSRPSVRTPEDHMPIRTPTVHPAKTK
jgi:hypothetical protein